MQNLFEVLLSPDFDSREVYGLGSWFFVPEADIREAGTGQVFASGKAKEGGRRPVILASHWGPNAILFPRSTRDQRRDQTHYHHQRHMHSAEFPRCKVSKCGWVLDLPVNVSVNEMAYRNWSCVESEGSDLHAEIERRLRS